MKTILSLAKKIYDIFHENFPDYTFCSEFFKLLSNFEEVRKKMLCKKLEENWEITLDKFMKSLTDFMDQSDSIGLVNFHLLSHSKQICKKYNVGLGCIGSDSVIESFHSHVMTQIMPHLGPSPVVIDNSIPYNNENMPAENMKDYHLNLFGRALEISLFDITDKNEKYDHKDYSKNKGLDLSYVKQFLSQINSKPSHFQPKQKSQVAIFENNLKQHIHNH